MESFRPQNPLVRLGRCHRKSRLHRIMLEVLLRERCGIRLFKNSTADPDQPEFTGRSESTVPQLQPKAMRGENTTCPYCDYECSMHARTRSQRAFAQGDILFLAPDLRQLTLSDLDVPRASNCILERNNKCHECLRRKQGRHNNTHQHLGYVTQVPAPDGLTTSLTSTGTYRNTHGGTPAQYGGHMQ